MHMCVYICRYVVSEYLYTICILTDFALKLKKRKMKNCKQNLKKKLKF